MSEKRMFETLESRAHFSAAPGPSFFGPAEGFITNVLHMMGKKGGVTVYTGSEAGATGSVMVSSSGAVEAGIDTANNALQIGGATNELSSSASYGYDGYINADDYFLIDHAFSGQSTSSAGSATLTLAP